jgi:two-component system phosphate regulon sensor histidine kinase PhoR
VFLNSRSVAFMISLLVAGLTVGVLALVPDVSKLSRVVAFITCFAICFGLVYVLFEYLIFKEVKAIYADLENIKRSQFQTSKGIGWLGATPLKKIKDEMYLMELRKQRELDELKRLESYRREFLADVSHELKTPVFAAQGFLHTLQDGAIDDERVRDKFLDKAVRSMDRLDVLVKDLISISQMEKGIAKMQRRNFDIIKMTNEVFEQLELKSEGRHMQLHLRNAGYQRLYVFADPSRIRQVLTNLVDNAIKYGREGGNIWVSFRLGKKKVLVSVRDDGSGIPEQHQNRIFERFYRIDKSRARGEGSGGSGLGLAISKHIIEAHRSRLAMTSTVGKGTTLRFKLAKGKASHEIPELQRPDSV